MYDSNPIKWWEQEYKYNYNVLKSLHSYVISGFRHQVDENCNRLVFLIITQQVVVISYWYFGTTYRSHLDRLSQIVSKKLLLLAAW